MPAAATSRLLWPGTVTVLTLAACAVGPDYHRPQPPAAEGYIGPYGTEALPAQTAASAGPGGEAQHLASGADLPGQWWTLFGSPQVTALVAQAMTSYPDIAAQQAALRQARANLAAEAGSFLPQIQGQAGATRQAFNYGSILPGLPTTDFNSFSAAVNVSYTFDVWGRERRTVEGLYAQAQEQGFELEASYLTLTSNVVSAAIQVASIREQIAATHEIIQLDAQLLAVAQRRFKLGVRTQADFLQQQTALGSVQASLPPLEQQLAAAEHQLALLTGRTPQEAPPPELTLTGLKLPQELPLSLPSSLIQQRPDIRAQEEALKAANAQVGVATANLLPQITLTGSYSDASGTAAALISPASNAWSITGGLTQPLFEGGTLRARRRAAIAAYDHARAQYQLVVLQAMQNVADCLTALHHDAQALAAQRTALEAARAGLDLIQQQYQIGAVDTVSLLTAQQAYQQARLAVVRATAARYTDTVALFQALGGGWWNRSDPRPAGEASVSPSS